MQGRPIAQAQELGVALSGWGVTGNEADLEVADFIDHMAADPDTRAIAAYVEGFCDGDRLRAAAVRALEEKTPIVLIKVGRSAAGADSSLTHTGHLAGSDAVHDAFFKQYAITRVDDLDELLEVSMVLSRSAVPETAGIGLLCTSGGSAAHIADLVGAARLPLPQLAEKTQSRLRQWIPPNYQVGNPVDNGGVALLQGHGPQIAETMLADHAVGVLFIPVTGVFPPHMDPIYDTVRHARRVSEKPIIVIWSGPTTNATYQAILDEGIPVVRNVHNAIAAADALLSRRSSEAKKDEFIHAVRSLGSLARSEATSTQVLDEKDSMAWLEQHGLRFAEHADMDSIDDAVDAAEKLGYPVVLKARRRGLVHKTEAGLVALGVSGAQELRTLAAMMLSRSPSGAIEGWIVARQMSGGVELLAGLSRDPLLGPVVTVGAGGVHAEMFNDVSLSVMPLTRARAWEMLAELRVAPLLDGYRGLPPVDKAAAAEVLLKLAQIGMETDAEEIDINPLLVTANGALGLDALVRIRC
jgi:acyl-CoA synthetase (NDP forming)